MLTALSLEEAVLGAVRILYPQDSFANEHPRLDLADPFALAIKQSYADTEGKELLFRNAGYFVAWAEKRQILLWEQLRQDTIHEYIQSLIARGLASKTIKSYLEPVRAAGKRVVAVYPDYYRDPCYGVRVPRKIGAATKVEDKVPKRALSIEEVIQLGGYLETQKYAECLVPATLLCGLLGCHVREVIFLTWKNVDLDKGIVRIEEEVGHKAKTFECVRMVPLPDFLIRYLGRLPHKSGRVIKLVSERPGHPVSNRPDNLIGQRFSGRVKNWKPDRYVPLSDLRNTLLNKARRDPQWPEYLAEQYVGHVDPSVTGKHYQSTDPIELLDHFKNGFLPLLNEEIERGLVGTKWQQNGKNPEVEAPGFEAQIIDLSQLA